MASNGIIEKKFAGGSYGGYYLGVEWNVNSQSTSSNSSSVTATVFIRTTGNGYTISSSATKDVSVTINGTKYLSTCTVGIGSNSRKNLFSKTVTVPHNSDGSKTCDFACALDINVTLSGTYYGKVTHGGSGTFDKINLNTPPTMGGYIATNPSGTIPENTGTLNLSWSKAGDAQGNGNRYQIYRYINGQHNKTIDIWDINTLNYTDDIREFGQGTKIDYTIWAGDTYGTWSNPVYSYSVTKNKFTGAWFSGHSNDVAWNTTTFSLNLTGATNTNGNGSFKYRIYSDDVTIYNQRDITSTTETITIWKSGTVPATPYIKFDDLKNKFRDAGFTGRLHVGVRTENAYGTQTWNGGSVGVDLRVAPTKPTSVTIDGGTALKTIATTGNKYYVPNGTDTIVVKWDGGYDQIGEPHQYKIYQILDGTVTYKDTVSGSTKSYTIVLPKQTGTKTLAFGVHTSTSYGYTDFRDSSAVTLHFYNPPSVNVAKVDRTDTTATATLSLKANTSIPNVNFPTRSYTGVSTGTLQNTQNTQTLTASGLNGGNKYNWTITLKDDTGLYSSNITQTIEIPAYTPLFSVREKGVGVNVIPDGSAGLMVNKGLKVDGKNINQIRNFGRREITIGGDKNTYYPVLFSNGASYGFATNKISISRSFNWKAPDDWNTSTHRGGLTLTWRWAGDTTWGGNSRVYTVEEFSETYTTMVAGMLNTTGGFIVWLRGGGALYQIDNDYGSHLNVNVYLDGYTAPDKNVYAPRTNTNNVQSEIMSCYCVRGTELYANNQKVLTNSDLSTNGTRNKVAYIRPDGVMEVGRYIDFHYEDDGKDYNGRLSVAGNGNLVYNNAIEASYLTVTDGGRLQINGNDKNLLVGTGGADCYITNSKTNSYLQLKDNGSLDFSGRVYLSSFNPSQYSSYFSCETSKDGNGSGDGQTHIGYNTGNGYSHYFRGSGSFNVDCHGGINTYKIGARFVNSPSGQNIDFVADSGTMFFDVKSSTGCGLIMDRRWSGSSGSEICLLNNKGSGWGFIGNSGQAFYRVYGTGGSVSERTRKYDIHKFDNEYLYDQVKLLNTYAYRTISDEVDEEGNKINELRRSDMQLGCMIQEMPIEVVLYDNEGGDGKAVDIYAYATMILGATKVLQTKLEETQKQVISLEKEKEDLKSRLGEIERILKENGIS